MSDKPGHEINVSLSELIGIHRDRLHISQSELARRVGISRNYVSLIERGHIENVSLKVLYRICHHLGLNVKIYYDGELASNDVAPSEGNLTMRETDGAVCTCEEFVQSVFDPRRCAVCRKTRPAAYAPR